MRVWVIALSLGLLSACGEPPQKEMHQAQGAIDAARAAGADHFAAPELQAAVDALERAEQAVDTRDYRLALGQALDSREQADTATRLATDRTAAARATADTAITAAAVVVQRAAERLAAADVVKLPRRPTAPIRTTLTRAEAALQEARSALDGERYEDAAGAAARATTEAEAALAEIDTALTPPRRSRRR
jgi:hypothetical protein